MQKIAPKEIVSPQIFKEKFTISQENSKPSQIQPAVKTPSNFAPEEILLSGFFKVNPSAGNIQRAFIDKKELYNIVDPSLLLKKAQEINPDVLAVSLERGEIIFSVKDKNGKIKRQASSLNIADPKKIINFFKNVFLPKDYKESCSKDYLNYRFWIAVSNFSSYVFNIIGLNIFFKAMMSTHASGAATAGAAAATAFTWVLKDLSAYAGILGSSKSATKVDKNPKKYLVQGAEIIAAGDTMDMAIAFLPQYALPISCIANAIKAAGGVRCGPATSAIEMHQALKQNQGEIRFKAMAQNAITSALGIAAAYGLQQAFANTTAPFVFPLIAAILKGVDIFATYKAAQSLDINNLTQLQLRKLIRNYILTGNILKPEKKGLMQTIKDIMKDKEEERQNCRLVLGEKINELTDSSLGLNELGKLYGEENYLLGFNKGKIGVALHKNAGVEDIVKAVFQAELLQMVLSSKYYKDLKSSLGNELAGKKAVALSYQAVPEKISGFMGKIKESKWDTKLIEVDTGDERYIWNKQEPSGENGKIALDEFMKIIIPSFKLSAA